MGHYASEMDWGGTVPKMSDDPWVATLGVVTPTITLVRDPLKSEYGRHRIALKFDGEEVTWQWFAPEAQPVDAFRALMRQWLR